MFICVVLRPKVFPPPACPFSGLPYNESGHPKAKTKHLPSFRGIPGCSEMAPKGQKGPFEGQKGPEKGENAFCGETRGQD